MAITYSLVAADWTFDNITGELRYIGHDHNGVSPSYATVIELHRWLGQLSDDQSPANVSDKMYIPIPKASERSTDNIITLVNGVNIDAVAAQHLYDGSIIQNGGDDIWDGILNFGNANVQIQIIRNGAIITDDFWNYNVGAACDSTDGTGATMTDSGETWVLNQYAGYTIKNTTDLCKGIVASNSTGGIATFRSTGELVGGTNDYFTSADNYLIGVPLNPSPSQGISHRFLIKVRENGADIDGRRLLGICRRMGNTFAWFPINGTVRGNNVLSLADSQDLNFDEEPQTVVGATWDSEFSGEDLGFQQFDVDANLTDEDYFGKLTWTGTHDINDLFQRAMGETADGTGYTVHGLDGEVLRGVTHSFGFNGEAGAIVVSDYDMLVWGTFIDHDAPTGAFTVGEVIVDEDPAGGTAPSFYATILSIDDTDDSMVVVIDSGVIGNTQTIYGLSSGADADTTSDPTEVSGGGVVHVLANDTANDILYVQVIKGTVPADDDTLYYGGTDLSAADHTDYLLVADEVDTIAEFSISKTAPYIGVSTGSAIIGSHGVGIDNIKLNSTDKVLPLGETTPISPPLSATNTLSGLVSAEDQILVAPTDGTTVDRQGDPTMGAAFFTIATILNGGAEATITVNEDLSDSDIDAWLPTAGYIDIVNDEGLVVTIEYDSYATGPNTFTLSSTYDFSGSGVNDSVAVDNYCFVYQMHLVTALTTGAEVAAAVNEIVGSTPDSGTIRIVNDDGFHIRHPYSVYNDGTDIFTITSAVFDGDGLTEQAAIGSGVYVTYIDKAADAATADFVAVYDNDLNLTICIRDGKSTPIKEDKKRWTFSDSNQTFGVTRTSDT